MIDYTCLIHGKKMSEHPNGICLYCCLCFKSLTPEECTPNADGIKEDVCIDCRCHELRGKRDPTQTSGRGSNSGLE